MTNFTLIFVASELLIAQYAVMVRNGFNILSILFFLLSIWYFSTDQIQQKTNPTLVGEAWFNNSPTSLQLAEVVIDRYIDPCSLISFLGCPSFLWHPTISSFLQLPASLVFFTLGVFILVLSQWLPRRRSRQQAYNFSRDGR